MNDTQQRFTRNAIKNYGINIGNETIWFIDDGKTFYGKQTNDGEIGDYLSGYISGNTFVVEYSSQEGNLDISDWESTFSHLELKFIDTRH